MTNCDKTVTKCDQQTRCHTLDSKKGFFNSVQKCDIESGKASKPSCMSQSTQDGDELNGDASGVIAPREGGLQPAAMGRGGAGRGGGQTPTAAARQRKSREAKALLALSSALTAGAAGGLAVQGAAAAPAQIVADAVASPGEESPTEADMYSSPKQKFWSDGDTCRMIVNGSRNSGILLPESITAQAA